MNALGWFDANASGLIRDGWSAAAADTEILLGLANWQTSYHHPVYAMLVLMFVFDWRMAAPACWRR